MAFALEIDDTREMNEFDITGRPALVLGGSSGIGNGIAQAFRLRGVEVHVWGTRPDADAYADESGSDLTGLCYQQVDVSRPDVIAEGRCRSSASTCWCRHRVPSSTDGASSSRRASAGWWRSTSTA